MTPARHPRRTILCQAVLLCAICTPLSGQGQTADHPSPLPSVAKKALEKGLSAAQAKQWDVAIRYFNDARRAAPGAPEPVFNLGLAEAQIPGRELRAIAWFEAYLALIPDAANAAQVRQQITDLDIRAEANARKLIEMLKALAAKLPADNVNRATDDLARILIETGDVDAALRSIESAAFSITFAPTKDDTREHAAMTLADKRRYADAANVTDQMTDYGSRARVHAYIASLQIDSRLLPEAKTSLANALKSADQISASDYGAIDTFNVVASAQIKAGAFSDAKASLDRVSGGRFGLSPSDSNRPSYFTYLGLAEAEYSAGQQKESGALLHDIREALERDSALDPARPKDWGAWAKFGVTEFRVGQKQDADRVLQHLQQFVENARDVGSNGEVIYFYDVAKAFFEIGDREKGLLVMRRCDDAVLAATDASKPMIPVGSPVFIYADLREFDAADGYLRRLKVIEDRKGKGRLEDQWYIQRRRDIEASKEAVRLSATKASALKSLANVLSPSLTRAQSWSDYLDAGLDTPLFLENFGTTLDALTHYLPPQDSDEKASAIFDHVKKPAEEVIDRLQDIRDLQAAAQKSGGKN